MSYQLPTQTQQAGPVVYTYIPQASNQATVNDNQDQSNLTTGWIVAIVTLVILAIALTYIFWNWRRRRNAGRYGQSPERYAESQEYMLQRPRAARVRDSIARFGGGGYR
jgi:heme/copper-type cytochrome/quinol oxidase subunit 2